MTLFWTLLDVTLAVVNLWHLFIVVVLLHPVESPLKKPLISVIMTICKAQNPLVTSFLMFLFIGITVTGGSSYYLSHDTIMMVRAIVGCYTTLCAAGLMKVTSSLMKLGPAKLLEYEHEIEKYDIKHYKAPPLSVIQALGTPLTALVKPDVSGIENVPSDKPSLFVMNHSLLGLEMGAFIETLYHEKGFVIRGLADHAHFASPHARVLRMFGAVDGTRENVDVLMEAKENILVYPGGGPEVMKHSSVPKYSLMWKDRVGFARMAIKHGYQIVPCAAVGTEDMLDIVTDIPISKTTTVPLVTTTPDRLQKVYFWFGEPISTAEYQGNFENTDFARTVRDQVKAAIESGIVSLQKRQEVDPERFLSQQIVATLRKKLQSLPLSKARDAVASTVVGARQTFSFSGSGRWQISVVNKEK